MVIIVVDIISLPQLQMQISPPVKELSRLIFTSCITFMFHSQGSWNMEGDMLKGIFNRKDNGKQLTTTRIVQGDELIQVGKTRGT